MEDVVNKQLESICKDRDEYFINFLKGKGYRPKLTLKYINGLKKRLKRKGLKINYYESISYDTPKDTKDGTIYSGKVKMLFYIDSIQTPIKGIDVQTMLDNWKG